LRRAWLAFRGACLFTGLMAVAAWVAAQVCPVCGKRSCPWYTTPSSVAAPSELIAKVRHELMADDPEFQRAKREGRLDRMTARLRALNDSEEFKTAVNVRLAREPEYNRYRVARLDEGERSLQKSQERLSRDLSPSGVGTREAIGRVMDADPVLRGYSEAQRGLVIGNPNLGQLFLAVGAGQVAITSREQAAKAISGTPFDDGVAGDAVLAAAREHRENVAIAIKKENEAVTRFQNIKEAAPTAAERAELSRQGQGRQDALGALARQAGLGSSAHAEARERVKGLVIEAPPPPRLDQDPRAAARALKDWERKAAETLKSWTIHVHDLYSPRTN